MLSRVTDMDPVQRERLLADVSSELEELSTLVGRARRSRDRAAGRGQRGARRTCSWTRSSRRPSSARSAARIAARRAHVAAAPVHGRPLALERAVSNLLDNAAKWGPADGQIDVVVGLNGDGHGPSPASRCLDRGPGIAEEDRGRVFDRFYRATAARSMPGSGLGLSIVKHVVEQHGGRVWANERPGGGAAIGFEIPAMFATAISPDS